MAADTQLVPAQGPRSYENWRAFEAGKHIEATYEVPLFTDAHMTGHVISGLGPYMFLNPVAIGTEFGLARPSVVLRFDSHFSVDAQVDWTRTDQSRYHGGGLADELAALASLWLGARLKAAGTSRIFENGGDVRGRPVAFDSKPAPVILTNTVAPILPTVHGTRCLNDLERFYTFPSASASNSMALVRAARLYQDAIWIAESEPSLTWLMLVSAVETVANEWRRCKGTPLERLRASKPDLVEYLVSECGEVIATRVAREFADAIGSTQNFTDFILTYLPPPPEKRPEFALLSWETGELKRVLRIVYQYRSKALHTGIPFPAPMCQAPFPAREVPAETPIGHTSTLYGVWRQEDIPIHLHAFEYLARKSILSWWESLRLPANLR